MARAAASKKRRSSLRGKREVGVRAAYEHILIPTDGSDFARKAIRPGIALAKSLGAQVTGITATVPFKLFMDPYLLTDTAQTYNARTARVSEKYLGYIKDAAKEAGVSCNVIRVEHEQPYRAIIDAAKKYGCDLILMASHGRRGFSALVLGSETHKVLTHSTIPVLVYR